MNKITVLNVYGAKNIGDQAILSVFLDAISSATTKDLVLNLIIEDDKTTYSNIADNLKIKNYLMPYGYAIRGRRNKLSYFVRLVRFAYMVTVSVVLYFLSKINIRFLPNDGIFGYIKAIYDADSVFGMGGGYFITKNSFFDYFGLILTLLPIWIARGYSKSILYLPMSVGPFANVFHERLTISALSGSEILCRENISYRLMKKYASQLNIKVSLFPDLAFFCEYDQKKLKSSGSNYIVVTAREWMQEIKQKEYEGALATLIDYAWKKYKLKTVFISMSTNSYEDDDNWTAKRIYSALADKSIMTIFNPKSFQEVQERLVHAKVAICTRMHSALLAFTVSTPFLLIGYGHKSKGVVLDLHLTDVYEDMENVNNLSIINSFRKVYHPNKYKNIVRRINKLKNEILNKESILIKFIKDGFNK